MRLLSVVLLVDLACTVAPHEGAALREAEWSTGSSSSSVNDDASTGDESSTTADYLAPNCEDGKELEPSEPSDAPVD